MNHCFETCHYQQNVPQHYYLLDTLVLGLKLKKVRVIGSSRGWQQRTENKEKTVLTKFLLSCFFSNSVFIIIESKYCGASVASEQRYKQDLKRIYRRGLEFSNSSLFTRMHCISLTRVHYATFHQSALRHEEFEDVTMDVIPLNRRAF